MVSEEGRWHYKINYGPEGEENYANVFNASGEFVGNLKIHHAREIVTAARVRAEDNAGEPIAYHFRYEDPEHGAFEFFDTTPNPPQKFTSRQALYARPAQQPSGPVAALLNEIACWSQSEGLLWWQIKAREALSALNKEGQSDV